MTTRRLAAILAADVVGFSSKMERNEEGVGRHPGDAANSSLDWLLGGRGFGGFRGFSPTISKEDEKASLFISSFGSWALAHLNPRKSPKPRGYRPDRRAIAEYLIEIRERFFARSPERLRASTRHLRAPAATFSNPDRAGFFFARHSAGGLVPDPNLLAGPGGDHLCPCSWC